MWRIERRQTKKGNPNFKDKDWQKAAAKAGGAMSALAKATQKLSK